MNNIEEYDKTQWKQSQRTQTIMSIEQIIVRERERQRQRDEKNQKGQQLIFIVAIHKTKNAEKDKYNMKRYH